MLHLKGGKILSAIRAEATSVSSRLQDKAFCESIAFSLLRINGLSVCAHENSSLVRYCAGGKAAEGKHRRHLQRPRALDALGCWLIVGSPSSAETLSIENLISKKSHDSEEHHQSFVGFIYTLFFFRSSLSAKRWRSGYVDARHCCETPAKRYPVFSVCFYRRLSPESLQLKPRKSKSWAGFLRMKAKSGYSSISLILRLALWRTASACPRGGGN